MLSALYLPATNFLLSPRERERSTNQLSLNSSIVSAAKCYLTYYATRHSSTNKSIWCSTIHFKTSMYFYKRIDSHSFLLQNPHCSSFHSFLSWTWPGLLQLFFVSCKFNIKLLDFLLHGVTSFIDLEKYEPMLKSDISCI